MQNKRIYGNETKYLEEVLNTEFRASSGAMMMKRFETAFSKRFNSTHGIAFVNGTATMHAALEAWGIGPGDEVIVPPLTMASTSFAVLQCNATPVFADVDPDTFQISPESIEKCITKNTKAIITVALFGLSPDMDPIMKIARNKNLKVIEDNAECFLGKYKGKIAGTIADCGSFSFQNSKHLTSGEGGILITNDDDFAGKVRKVMSLGYAGVSAKSGKVTREEIQHPDYARHGTMGWNYRMPDLCCAVALAQLENIDYLVEQRIKVANLFNEVVKPFSNWFKPQFTPNNYVNSYWTFVTKLLNDEIKWETIRNKFKEQGGDGVYACWKLTYEEPCFQNLDFLGRENFISDENKFLYTNNPCPIAKDLQPRLFCFKTNYWDFFKAEKQAEILYKTLSYYN